MSSTTKDTETSNPHEAVFDAEKESTETQLQDLHGEVQETLTNTDIKPLIDGPPIGGSLTGLANDKIINDGDEADVSTESPVLEPSIGIRPPDYYPGFWMLGNRYPWPSSWPVTTVPVREAEPEGGSEPEPET